MGGLEEHLLSYVEVRKEGLVCEGLPLPEHLMYVLGGGDMSMVVYVGEFECK